MGHVYFTFLVWNLGHLCIYGYISLCYKTCRPHFKIPIYLILALAASTLFPIFFWLLSNTGIIFVCCTSRKATFLAFTQQCIRNEVNCCQYFRSMKLKMPSKSIILMLFQYQQAASVSRFLREYSLCMQEVVQLIYHTQCTGLAQTPYSCNVTWTNWENVLTYKLFPWILQPDLLYQVKNCITL